MKNKFKEKDIVKFKGEINNIGKYNENVSEEIYEYKVGREYEIVGTKKEKDDFYYYLRDIITDTIINNKVEEWELKKVNIKKVNIKKK